MKYFGEDRRAAASHANTSRGMTSCSDVGSTCCRSGARERRTLSESALRQHSAHSSATRQSLHAACRASVRGRRARPCAWVRSSSWWHRALAKSKERKWKKTKCPEEMRTVDELPWVRAWNQRSPELLCFEHSALLRGHTRHGHGQVLSFVGSGALPGNK